LIIGCGPRLPYRINVPSEFRQDPPGWIPPNGEPERVRYASTYEPFWWNCTILKSQDLDARCPFTCSGTPGATRGCGDGATDAENAINRLVEKLGKDRTKALLERRVREGSGYSKIKSRFPNGPEREIVR
jgi:hypothetical protein